MQSDESKVITAPTDTGKAAGQRGGEREFLRILDLSGWGVGTEAGGYSS